MSNIIEIKNITKEFKVLNRREGLKGSLKDLFSRNYKIVRAVDNISMNIEQGEIVGYLGPNGAGKSTTIKMMTGILEPTSGKILVNGSVPYKDRTKNARRLNHSKFSRIFTVSVMRTTTICSRFTNPL